ncbi:MFS transporter [Jiangella ureilytica]|uniref:MFS transporter n=1 Tax=Jiangella ureilytica TaxID=2530374 RepID=A0A4R4RK38_9ACTN|nr:MFS transporter [Jiangella ureilytica]TDC49978.1 MFS transporter [Jiangella ureilytica]
MVRPPSHPRTHHPHPGGRPLQHDLRSPTAALLDHLSWRQTYVVLAILLAVTTIPGHALGLTAPWPATHHGQAHTRRGNGHIRAVATSRAFLCLTISAALTAFTLFATTIDLIPLLTDRGLTMTLAAAWALGLSGAGQLLGRIGYAPLSRRTSPRFRSVGFLPGPAAALIAATFVLGIARGEFTLLQSTAISDRWGIAGFGTSTESSNAPPRSPWPSHHGHSSTTSRPSRLAGLKRVHKRIVTRPEDNVLASFYTYLWIVLVIHVVDDS